MSSALASLSAQMAKMNPTLVPQAEATIDPTRSFNFLSRFTEESYRVNVYLPRVAPRAGYPVFYVLGCVEDKTLISAPVKKVAIESNRLILRHALTNRAGS